MSKIEHQQFSDTTSVNFEKLVEDILINFNDLIQIQEINIQRSYQEPFEITMSETLAEILVANLLQNAIRYNEATGQGFIKIQMDANSFTISNPGPPPSVPTDQLLSLIHISEPTRPY